MHAEEGGREEGREGKEEEEEEDEIRRRERRKEKKGRQSEDCAEAIEKGRRTTLQLYKGRKKS